MVNITPGWGRDGMGGYGILEVIDNRHGFITCGLRRRGTGTGAAPVIAEIASAEFRPFAVVVGSAGGGALSVVRLLKKATLI